MSNQQTSIKLTLEQRKMILKIMNYSYTIPSEYHKCVADAIKRYATKSLSDEAICRMVEKNQSVANSGFLLHQDSVSLFRGKFAEWLACIEYNAVKNSNSVIMTIVNPDETSKADLLHFIKVGNEFKAVAGPDIKSGSASYVFNQWKKIVTGRYDIPMVDFDGKLTTEEGLKQLKKNERIKFEELGKDYPRKHPISSMWSNQDELRLRIDYFKDILDIEGNFQYSPEVSKLLKMALISKNISLPRSDWSEFNKKCKEIFKDFDEDSLQNNNSYKENLYNEPKTRNQNRTINNNFKNNNKKIPWGKLAGTVAKYAVTVGVMGVTVASMSNFRKTKSLKSILEDKVKKIPWKKVINSVAKSTAVTFGKTIVSGKTGSKKVSINTRKEKLRGTHSSPILHQVNGYVRKNGTKVKSYERGRKK